MQKRLEGILHGKKGGLTTVKVIDILMIAPSNANEIAKIIKMDYNTVKYHLTLLKENNLVIMVKEGYGAFYAISDELQKNEKIYNTVKKGVIDKNRLK